MRLRAVAALAWALPLGLGPFSPRLLPGPDAVAVFAEFDRMTARELWPGFEPRALPLAIYDGDQTYLVRHPAPPDGFTELSGHPGVFVLAGRHPALTGNSSADLGGVQTATYLMDPEAGLTARAMAAVLVHEAFHVYQRQHHPEWSGDEGALFLYPVHDADLLTRRRLETFALARALLSLDDPRAPEAVAPDATGEAGAACWAAAALAQRRERFRRLPPEAPAYERKSELNEGLAQYLQDLAGGSPTPRLLVDLGVSGDGEASDVISLTEEYPADAVRERIYGVGQALAILLERLDPEWKRKLEAEPAAWLDELLGAALERIRPPPCAFSAEEEEREQARARELVEGLVEQRRESRRAFLARPGERLTLVAGAEPLWPQGFDPLNVRNLEAGEVLHTRWLKVGNGAGTLEVLDREALTRAAGAHPLFNGFREVVITGLEEAQIEERDGTVSIRAEGIAGELKGARLERSSGSITIRL